jgi:transposase
VKVQVQLVQGRGITNDKVTPEFKARLVLEELTGVKNATKIRRAHRLKPQVFSRWKAGFIERAPEIFATQPSRGDEQARLAELGRMMERLTMELEYEPVQTTKTPAQSETRISLYAL